MSLHHEVNKFNELAHDWWNIDGAFKTLHQLNPARLAFIQQQVNLCQKQVIDIGCGGGILSEAMAKLNAQVSAIDLAPQSIEIAKLHLYESNLAINYECIDSAEKALLAPNSFDVLTCMEMLEHVPNPNTIIENCAKLLKPNGLAFFSTLNRNYKSYLLGVLAAEYVLHLVPKNTHNYKQFITPAELRTMLINNGLQLIALQGISYNPLNTQAKLSNDTSINYLVACQKICQK